jgi:hypothetical protein
VAVKETSRTEAKRSFFDMVISVWSQFLWSQFPHPVAAPRIESQGRIVLWYKRTQLASVGGVYLSSKVLRGLGHGQTKRSEQTAFPTKPTDEQYQPCE